MSLKLGQLLLRNKFILSPLESVSDVGFRQLCYKNGASLTWTEMIRCQAVARNNNSALDLIDTFDPMTLTGLQLLAKTSDDLLRALHHLEDLSSNGSRPHFKNIAAIDLNFGCPSPDVIREGAGPALLCRRKRLEELLSTLVNWKNHPDNKLKIGAVGCKIRLGKNQTEQSQKVYLRVAAVANEVGIDYLTVHARHAKQLSSELPTWSAIREIKEMATMPVIANGNIANIDDAERVQRETGCDGFMVARAAIRNPWIFRHFTADKKDILSNQAKLAAIQAQAQTEVADRCSSDPLRGVRREFYDSLYWPSEGQVQSAMTDYNSMQLYQQQQQQQQEPHGAIDELSINSAKEKKEGNGATRDRDSRSRDGKGHGDGGNLTTKAKYKKFHEINFGRILMASRDKDVRAAPFVPPKTIHI